jgi:hypothetical protein
VTAPPGEGRRSEWLADLEELADLAAETVAPQEVDEARRRRSAYSGERLASLLTVLPAGKDAATAPAPGAGETVVPGPGRAGALAPARGRPAVPVWAPTPTAVIVPLPQARQAPVPLPHPGQAVVRRPRPDPTGGRAPARRLLAPGLALLGAGALCTGLLLRLPGPDPATPLGGGAAYSTPTPVTGSTSLQPAPIEPAAPDPALSPPPPAEGSAVPSGVTAPLPVAAAGAPPREPGVTARVPAGPPARPSTGAAPVVVPAVTASPAPSPTAMPATAPPSTPGGGAVAVRSVTLSMGTCEDRGAAWVCPETATFVLSPGAHGTLSFRISGTAVTCSGASTGFDRAQPDVDIPAGTTQATVSSALLFPAGGPPAAAGPGGAASTARVEVTAPNPVSSAPVTFGAASCP